MSFGVEDCCVFLVPVTVDVLVVHVFDQVSLVVVLGLEVVSLVLLDEDD